MVISIPIFTTQLEKSRDAVTLSNLRAAYAEASAACLVGDDDKAAGVTLDRDAKTATVTNVDIKCTDGKADLSALPFTDTGMPTSAKDDETVVFTFSGSGATSATIQ